MSLLPSQRDRVFELITEYGFDPSTFSWAEEMGRYGTFYTLQHNDTDYRYDFNIRSLRSEYDMITPGIDKLEERYPVSNWKKRKEYIKIWLMNLERELATPNYWANIGKYHLVSDSNLVNKIPESEFTEPEIETIVTALGELKNSLMTEFAELKGHQDIIDENFDYLIKSAKRQDRRTFALSLLGYIGTIVTSYQLDSKMVNTLWTTFLLAIKETVPFLQLITDTLI